MAFRHALIDWLYKKYFGRLEFARKSSSYARAKWVLNNPVAKGQVGLLAIMKNESMNIVEWLDHYKWQGVDQIFLIDNASTDDSVKKVKAYSDDGFVELYFRAEPHRQVQHYRRVLEEAEIKKRVEWLIVADLDEFWYAKEGTLKQYLLDMSDDIDLVYAPWRMFGSSGLSEHPDSVRKCFTLRWPLSAKEPTKWVVRTSSLVTSNQINIHKVHGIDSGRVLMDSDGIRLNHYVIQSKSYFESVKMTRGDVAKSKMQNIRDWDYFNKYDSPATVYDDDILRFLG